MKDAGSILSLAREAFKHRLLSVENVFLRYSITDIVRAEVEDEHSRPQTRRTSLTSRSFVLRLPCSIWFFLALALYISFSLRLVCGVLFFSSFRLKSLSVHPSVCPSLIWPHLSFVAAQPANPAAARRLINSSSSRSCRCFCSRLCCRGLKYRMRGIFGRGRPGGEMRGGVHFLL